MTQTRNSGCWLPGRPWMLLAVLAGLLWPFELFAVPPDFTVPINKGMVITLPEAADRIQVGNPEQTQAEVSWLDPRHIYVLGRKLGTTNVILCGKTDHCHRTLKVEVTHDLENLKRKLHEIFPNESPKVYSSQQAIVLAGQVSSVEKMNAILAIAGTFAKPGEAPQNMMGGGGGSSGGAGGGSVPVPNYDMNPAVVNLMQVGGPQQVMLGVTVAEMSTSLARDLKVNFSAFGGGTDIRGGAIDSSALINAITNATATAATAYNPSALFLRFAGSDATVRTFITASRDNGLAKILAEPNLTTISGQDAEFQSGGSFPIPVFNFGGGGGGAGTAGGANVVYKDYGVILKFLPVVLDTNRISLKLNIQVSELSNENAVTLPSGDSGQSFVIPALIQRGATSSLELDSGQTMGIAGLINDRTRESIKKFPGLGDIPVLGQLFTSQSFQRAETELMIFVTPQLAKPFNPDTLHLPTDDFVEPDDTEYYWMGRTEGLVDAPTRPRNQRNNMGGLRGHYGQKVQNMRQ